MSLLHEPIDKEPSFSLESFARDLRTQIDSPAKTRYSYASFIPMSFFIFLCGIMVAGFIFSTNSLTSVFQNESTRLKWMVLVQGNSVQIDEVGAFLSKLPNVKATNYVSPEQAVEQVKQNNLFTENFSDIRASDLPGAWVIDWDVDQMNLNQLDDLIGEIRSYGNVIDIAYDQPSISFLSSLRALRKESQMTLSIVGITAVVFGALILLRFFTVSFRNSFSFLLPFNRKPFWQFLALTLLNDQFWWSMAYLLAFKTFGPLPWAFLPFGLLFGLLHALWILPSKK